MLLTHASDYMHAFCGIDAAKLDLACFVVLCCEPCVRCPPDVSTVLLYCRHSEQNMSGVSLGSPWNGMCSDTSKEPVIDQCMLDTGSNW